MEKSRKILVTAALPYANGPIHLGHMVEYLQADFWVRFQNLRGHDCRYFCADDTHGTPIFLRAKKEGVKPEKIIAQSAEDHQKDFSDFGIHFDNFSSTNSETNRELSELIFKAMEKGGHIALRGIQQTYCEHDKMFLPDRLVNGTCPSCHSPGQYGDSCDNCGATYSPTDLLDASCSICGNKPVERQSEHIFFKLNDFKDFLKGWVPEHNSVEVSKKLNEWLDGDLRDWDISRDAPYFGFEIPGHPNKYFYVWVDAPVGYISSSKEWCETQGRDYLEYWGTDSKAEVYHFIGKDIIYFHSLFWPAMLKAANFRQPSQVCVHGFLTVNGTKMSKSKGTFIMARTYLEHLDPSFLRYYYGCKLGNNLDDIDLNLEDFVQRVNSDLVGKVINLASRSAKILQTHFDNRLADTTDPAGLELIQRARTKKDLVASLFEKREFSKAMVEVRNIADEANRYIDDVAPWKLVKEDKVATHQCLTATLSVFRILAVYLTPILPELSRQVAAYFAQDSLAWKDIDLDIFNHQMNKFQHLLQRIDAKKVDKMVSASQAKTDKKETKKETASSPFADIKDFQKLDLRIGEVISAEIVKESDKLLKLMVDIGEEQPRTIFSGIKKSFKAEELVGEKVLVVANLKPRKMKFGVSEGMVLLAEDASGLSLVTSKGASSGSKVE